MVKYRRKPVIIEAVQFNDPAKYKELGIIWVKKEGEIKPGKESFFKVATLAGEMLTSLGSWIVPGGKGECYSIENDILKKFYEIVETA